MTAYDKLDWHAAGAIAAGQPPAQGFVHIGLYVAWLIRHDLHNPRRFSAEDVAAVKQGRMTGSDLADDIDGKLVPPVMNREGRAFSAARYATYLAEYERVFADRPDYGAPDDPATYERVAAILDQLYAAWVTDGRPAPPAEASPTVSQPPLPIGADFPPPESMTSEDLQAALAALARFGWVVGPVAGSEDPSHTAPDLEALIPSHLTTPPIRVESMTAQLWGSSRLRRSLKRLDVRPADATVVVAMGGPTGHTLVVTLYGVPGVAADRQADEMPAAIARPTGGRWRSREVAGRTVTWASGREFSVAFWTLDGLVVHVAGPEDDVLVAIPRLLQGVEARRDRRASTS
ncbi:MAG TPA: hypothetical protein VMH24_07035 [Candidatus Sulfotelmatobacter sp.]|nr:hypothetical protein [Candidatus Sulfotelmatobacter sp.]